MPRDYGITNAAPYASAPAVGAAGDTYYNTAEKVLYVSDGTSWINRLYARVSRSTVFSLPSGSNTTVTFDTAESNVGALWTAGAPTKLVAPTTGLYVVGGTADFDAHPTGIRWLTLQTNTAPNVAVMNAPGGHWNGTAWVAGYDRILTISGLRVFTAGQYVEMLLYQDSGVALNLLVGGGMNPTMWMARLG